MAEFCSECTPFEYPDIDLAAIALDLSPGRSESFICEGCNNRAVYKDEKGGLYLAKAEDGVIKLHPVIIEQLMK
ncbi:hypothetical protein GCM10027291_45740 [Telluribacter humicola]